MKPFALILLIFIAINNGNCHRHCLDLTDSNCDVDTVADVHLVIVEAFSRLSKGYLNLLECLAHFPCHLYIQLKDACATLYVSMIRFLLGKPGPKCLNYRNAVKTYDADIRNALAATKIYRPIHRRNEALQILHILQKDYNHRMKYVESKLCYK